MNTENIKQILKKKIPFFGNLVKAYSKFKPKKIFDSPEIWISRLLTEDNVSIVQIGSNDGELGDPLCNLIRKNTSWHALFVEPVPYLYERLKNNYGTHPRFSFENVAVNDGTEQTFYSVKEEAKTHISHLPDWYDQLGSFYKGNILKHLDGVLEPFLEGTLVSGMTLETLFNKNNIKEITLLHIDTEGYDWKILSQLNLELFYPKVILFEYKHLPKTEKKESITFLKSKYSIFELGGDLLCLNKNLVNIENFKDLRGQLIK